MSRQVTSGSHPDGQNQHPSARADWAREDNAMARTADGSQPRTTMELLAPTDGGSGVVIVPAARAGADHPAAVYMARLAPGSRRTIYSALERMAGLLSGGSATIWTLQWAALRYQHTAALR